MASILVITPTLNRPTLCPRAVASLFAQDFADWTLVIAKNGGAELVDAYKAQLAPYLDDPRVHFQVLPGKGIAYALNGAMSAFQDGHEYFGILEDDDEWEPSFLSKMKDALDQSGADVALCLCRQLPEARGGWGAGGPMNPGLILMGSWIAYPQCLFRMPLYRMVGGFSEDAAGASDWDWQIRCVAASAKHTFVNEVLMTHHWHGSNTCQTDGKPAYARIVEWIRSGRYPNMSRMVAALRAEAAAFHVKGNFRMAEPMYVRALEINPGDAEIWALAGQLAVQMGNPELATQRLQQALALDVSNADATYQIAGLYAALGDHANAHAMLERTLSLAPGHLLAQRALHARS